MAQAVGKKTKESIFTGAFSSFSVDDLNEATEFYGKTLGIDVSKTDEGLELRFDDGGAVFIYPKDDHEPATFTVLNLQVDDIEQAVDELTGRGITFEEYEGEMRTDEKGIFRGDESDDGPNIAWFKDPAGNFVSVIEN
jgi:catechol 2,3-dioxygenase-like lactoylglutathione lyase family enzyme